MTESTVQHFFDKRTFTLTYVVFDPQTKDAVVIDPVLDYEPVGSRVFTESLELVLDFLKRESLIVHYVLETHAHADHISGSPFLKQHYPKAKLVIGENIKEVQKVFRGVFFLEDLKIDGSQFDILFSEGQTLQAGSISISALHTPGHTPACLSYHIGTALFVGDSIFQPDYGTGRCDFPGGDSHALYHSIHEKIYALPDSTAIYVGHDYLPYGRTMLHKTTVGDEKKSNVHLPWERTEAEFVQLRNERDKTLEAPKLLFPSVYVNIMGGGLPPRSPNGSYYFKTPITIKDPQGILSR